MEEFAPPDPGERGTSVSRRRVLGKRIGGVPPDPPRNDERSLPRFSLGCLLIGFAIFSSVTAGLAYLGKAVYIADQAEKNLIAYRAVSEALARFVDGRGRWPTNESELRTFAESLPDWSDRGVDVFDRTIVAYDFDIDRDSLVPDAFRGLRYREPIYPGPADNARDRLLARLQALRDLHEGLRRLRAGQASPDDEEMKSANEEDVPADSGSGERLK